MQYTDFSVVLFRPTFMLVSEKNRMKVHTNQWLLTMPCPLEHLAGATSRGQTMAPEGQKPYQWRCLTKLQERCAHNLLCSKHFHRGAICKSACILAEITIRKSQYKSHNARSTALRLTPRHCLLFFYGFPPAWRLRRSGTTAKAQYLQREHPILWRARRLR